MNRVLLLSGVLLFVLGSVLFIGSYVVFNKYSVSGSYHFSSLSQRWGFPSRPLELNEGDQVAIRMSKSGSGNGMMNMGNTAGQKVPLSELGNWTDYYYVQNSNLWYCYTEINSIGSNGIDLALSIEVTRKAPNLLFQLIGGIIVLAGAVTIPIAFLYKNRIT